MSTATERTATERTAQEEADAGQKTGTTVQGMLDDLRGIPGWAYRKLHAMAVAVAGADNDPSLHRYHPNADDAAMLQRVNRRAIALAQEREGLRMWRGVIVFGSGALPLAVLLLVPDWDGNSIRSFRWILGGCLAFVEFFLLISLLFVRARVASLNGQLQILEYENVLTSFKQSHEKRAANLFFKHQAELQQYYDQALRQNKQSFVLGVVCVVFGLGAILAVATLLLANPQSDLAAKLAVGGLGILSVLLTGFVARIYLRVYEESAKALGNFHDRLVSTNDYHFASLLISAIDPREKRMDALSELARAIAAPRPPAEPGAANDAKD